MDEAGARARIGALSRPPDVENLSKEIDEVCALKEKAISEQHFEEAARSATRKSSSARSRN